MLMVMQTLIKMEEQQEFHERTEGFSDIGSSENDNHEDDDQRW